MKKRIATLLPVFILLLASVLPAARSAAQSENAEAKPQQKPLTRNDRQPGRNRSQRAAPQQTPQPQYDLSETPTNYPLRELEFFERHCFDEVNRQREAQKLAPLIFSEELLPVARHYSRRLAEEKFFSHTDPQGRTTRDRLLDAGVKFLLIGENLSQANGYLDPVPDVVQNWMRNPAHRANILTAEFKYAVVGVWIKDKTFFFTEIFLTK
jgi:uncharacterized protein YkwD